MSGDVVAPQEVSGAMAKDLTQRLLRGQIPFTTLIECRRDGEFEILVIDIETEVPQRPVYDIRGVERLGFRFRILSAEIPRVFAIRADFPQVPHLNIAASLDEPKSLCLFEEPYRDLKSRLTAPLLLERARDWLRLTARGQLHGTDQPLEPLLTGVGGHLIVPHAIVTPLAVGDVPAALSITSRGRRRGQLVLVAERATKQSVADSGDPFAALVFQAKPRTHGLIVSRPRTLASLNEYLTSGGDRLLEFLRPAVAALYENHAARAARLVLVVVIPKTRSSGGEVEETDVLAFASVTTLRDVGISLGVFLKHEGDLTLVMVPDPNAMGHEVALDLLNVTTTLSRAAAAGLSGREVADDRKFVAVGVGALGSQVAMNLARIAFGRWTLVDEDMLLPHNAGRHMLSASVVGHSKAMAVTAFANDVVDAEDDAFDALDVDVFAAGADGAAIDVKLAAASAIVDMSASVTVGRFLALDAAGTARRLSLFLNPIGTDLVLLSEDSARQTRLDVLEMQYYRALLRQTELADHLRPPDERVRYGRSCRDVSMRVSQESVALHAAVATRAIRAAVDDTRALIRVWRSSPHTGEVRLIEIVVEDSLAHAVNGWTVKLDRGLLSRIGEMRASKLPAETGGVLVGVIDLSRRTLNVVDTLPAPPDSEERPTWYIRGTEGLPAAVREVEVKTGGQVEYLGEWHSHPVGHSCAPSTDDVKLFGWLTRHMDALGLPALMMIAGDADMNAIFVGEMYVGEVNDDHRIAVVGGITSAKQPSAAMSIR
jgi:hypothetical protein